jgi:D-alanyl-D-alanine carboxypeptidase
MKRRKFLKSLAAFAITAGVAPAALAAVVVPPRPASDIIPDDFIRDYLVKMKYFNKAHPNDIYLDPEWFRILESSLNRLKRLQRTVGHGNFYLLNFDEALKIARNYTRVGAFTAQELNFLEQLFYSDGAQYGFFGEKPLKNLTDRIKRGKVTKIPYSGNYLYKGRAVETYRKIRQDLGKKVILTSGVRSVIKQFMLFLGKAYNSKGNLSMASRSLAPPGYSFHGIGDFDVGQTGYGIDNFTERFTTTEVFRRLRDCGYLSLRYDHGNLLGVRFEPWHIKVGDIG